MKHAARLIAILVFITTVSKAQQGAVYQADLSALHNILKKTPSYKDQVKGEIAIQYQNKYVQLMADTANIHLPYQYFYQLSQLFFPLRDNHLAFYQLTKNEDFKDKASFDDFTANRSSIGFPKYNINIDSLKEV